MMQRPSSSQHRQLAAVLCLAIGVIGSVAVFAQGVGSTPAPAGGASPLGDDVTILPIRGNVTLVSIGDMNSVVQVGPEGVLVVDTMTDAAADRLLQAIRIVAPGKPIRYVVNTSAAPDKIGGNLKVAEAGSQLVAGNFAAQLGQVGAQSAFIVAHENVLKRVSAPEGGTPALPFGAWPTETYFQAEHDRYFNDEGIQLLHPADGYSDGDSVVFFRSSDVLVAGEVFSMTGFPVIDRARGGHVNGVIESLNTIIDLAISKMFTEGGTVIVPGRGRLTDEFDVVEYRDMVTIIKERIEAMSKRGMSLEAIQAARPALDYEPRFGAAQGAWTTAMFVEAVYQGVAGTARATARRGE